MFIDTHCHFKFEDLGSHGDKSVNLIEDAKKNDVGIIVDIATNLHHFQESIDFANKHDNIFVCLAVHPLYVQNNIDVNSSVLEKYIQDKKVIGIGETGLDYHRSQEHIVLQKKFFTFHAETAAKYNLPIAIHTRDAHEDTLDMLSSFVKNYNSKGIIHCFSGNVDLAKLYLDLGFHISFSGIVTFKNALEIQEVAKYVPLDRMLIETDSPYLAPIPYRGKVNQPAYTKYVGEFIASIRNMNINILQQQLYDNFYSLFTKAKPVS